MSNNFDYLSDENLVTIIIVHYYQNSEEYQQSLLKELKRRNIDINQFNNDENYIKSFINSFPDGWSNEIQIMFDELLSLGWNKSMHLEAKEKWGYFTFSGGNLSEEMYDVIKKHAKSIDNTCSRCGSKDHVQGNNSSWIEILCRKCAQKDLSIKGIYNISDKGFTYANVKSENINFLWEEVTTVRLKFSEEEQSITFDFNRIVEEYYGIEEYSLHFNFLINLNFLKLFKNIPEHLLDSSDSDQRIDFFSELKNCVFCDKKTVYLSKCLLCDQSLEQILRSRTNQYLKFYNNISKVIDKTKDKTMRFIDYSNELHFFHNNDYFLD